MKKMSLIGMVVLALVASNSAFAAKYRRLERAESLSHLQDRIDTLCRSLSNPSLDCGTEVFGIVSKNPTEKWENTVAQLLRTNKYVNEASVQRLVKRGKKIIDQFYVVAEAGGYDERYSTRDISDALELAVERIENDVLDEPSVFAFGGNIGGEFSLSHAFMTFIDTESGEVLVFSAGYSE